MIILMNLKEDLDRLTTASLACRGYVAPETMDGLTRYAILERHVVRSILPIAYSIAFSDELNCNPLLTSNRAAVDEIVHRLSAGDSISPYQSRSLQKPDYDDKLLAFCGIHHFHLSSITSLESDGFVKRADYLLFIRFEDNVAHLIDILPHKKPGNQNVFFDLGLLEIVDRNWPHLHQQVNNWSGNTYTEPELKALRKNNSNHMLQVNGRAVMPTTGVMSNGSSFRSVMNYDNLCIQLEALESDLRRQYFKYFGHRRHWIAHVTLTNLNAKTFELEDTMSKQKFTVPRGW